jgi:hypothetical protein
MDTGPLSVRELAPLVAILAVVGALVFGPHVLHGGFYNDDWEGLALSRYPAHSGLLGAIDAFGFLSFRPVDTVYWPLLYGIFGGHQHFHLAWAVTLGVAESACLFAVLRTLGMARVHAVAVALLLLLFPRADSTRLWVNSSISTLSITLYLLGTLVALRALTATRRSVVMHGGAVVLYLLSMWTYEVTAGAIACSLLVYRLRSDWWPSCRRWAVDLVAVVLTLTLISSGTWNTPTSFATDVHQVKEIVIQAGSVLTQGTFPFGTPVPAIVLGLLALVALTGVLVWRLSPTTEEGRVDLRRWLLAALAGLIALGAGYVMFVPAGSIYLPLRPGQFNRVNNLAAIGYVILVYSLGAVACSLVLRRLARGRPWAALAPPVLAAIVAAGYAHQVRVDGTQWNLAASIQNEILGTLHRALPHPPPGAVIYSLNHPVEAAPGVPVFAATWDLSGAVETQWHDPTLSAYPAIPATTFVCGRTSLAARNANNFYKAAGAAQTGIYGSAFLFDFATGRVARITDRAEWLSQTRLFHARSIAGPAG